MLSTFELATVTVIVIVMIFVVGYAIGYRLGFERGYNERKRKEYLRAYGGKQASVLLVALLMAAPVTAQTRLYTNADLNKPITWSVPPPSPQVMAGLVARQFVWYPASSGPFIFISSQTVPSSGPWSWPTPAPVRRLDGTPITIPPMIYGVVPWLYPHWNRGSEKK